MQADNVHDFHFILDREMKDRIEDLEVFKGYRGLSSVIVKILQVLAPVVKREHKWGEQRMGRYKNVCDDPDEVREDVHVYMPGRLYRELKLLHQDLNVYSIAQLVRGFIGVFLGFVEVYKENVFQELKKTFARWLEEEKQTQLTPREVIRQLLKIIQHLPGKNRPVHIYDRDFSPFWVFRM